jgi:16S rRNA (cytosine1402-N4)-methyltransferase
VVLAVVTNGSDFADPGCEAATRDDFLDSGTERPIFHRSVLLSEVVERLSVRTGGVYVDATVGEGGHAAAILQASAPGGRVLGVDLDLRSLSEAARRVQRVGGRFISTQGNYAHLVELARNEGVDRVDGVLMDLGFSSRHIEAPGYGFSFQIDEPLDMRYDPSTALTADQIVNTYAERELTEIISRYGEEPRARLVARAIVRHRPITSTSRLAGLVAATIRSGKRRRTHPATRTFQALRIAVNDELANLEAGVLEAVRLLAAAGRLVVISYHSLEDRVVKTVLAREAASCICPPGIPVCICGHQPTLKIVNRRVIRPSPDEVESNPRSRSARMRVAERR